jgi:hypothetical protein
LGGKLSHEGRRASEAFALDAQNGEECNAAGAGERRDLRVECRRQIDKCELRGSDLEEDASAREVSASARGDEAETA